MPCEGSDELRLDITGVLVRSRQPCHQQVGSVGELPHVSASPVANGFSSAVPAVLIKALAEAAATLCPAVALPM